MCFPHSSVGEESTCNARDPSLIPGSERSTGERIDYPLKYTWASLMAQLVKNLSAMWETWVQSLGWEDLLEKGKATHSSILAWRIPWTVQSKGSQRVRHNWATFTFHFHNYYFSMDNYLWLKRTEEYLCSWFGKLGIISVSLIPKIYRFSAISMNTPMIIFA